MNGGVRVLTAASLLTVACGGLARDPDSDLPPPFSSTADDAPRAAPDPGPPPTIPALPPAALPPSPTDAPLGGATVLRCEGSSPTNFGAMNLTVDWDFISVRASSVRRSGTELAVEESEGNACDSAIDTNACFARLNDAWPPTNGPWTECRGSRGDCTTRGIASTSGDEVRSYASFEELKALLGPIDTVQEAALWARVNGFAALCDATTFAQPRDGSYLLAVGAPPRGCGQLTTRLYIRVMSDGTVIHQRGEEDRTTPGCLDTIR